MRMPAKLCIGCLNLGRLHNDLLGNVLAVILCEDVASG